MYKKTLIITISFIIFTTLYSYCSPSLNLEDSAQDFILEVKQVIIPQYPHAFNPSIIRWKGSLLMSFRVIPNPKQSFTSWLGIVWLNENFEPISEPQQLITRNPASQVPSRAEDGRLITVNDKLYLIYSDNENLIISKGGFRVYIAELDFDGKRFYIKHRSSIKYIERLSEFPGNNINRREKNWTPFSYKNRLLLAYSLHPHTILEPQLGTNSAVIISSSINNKISWSFGELRGGTCALLDSDHYLGFFHSACKMATVHSQHKEVLHYFMGAYKFRAQPPFNITHISPEPIIGKKFYSGTEYTPYWHPVRAIFPCGLIYDEKYIWIAYGRQDHEMWITKLDKEQLYKSLIKI
jgi:predicted GH43/DUF377 family glycosyl hydrolase